VPDADPGSLDRLHDIVTPPPVPWWPPAPGWYVVGGVGLVLLGVAAWAAVGRWWAGRYRRAALRELDQLPRGGKVVPAVAELLKRTALAAFPRDRVASLTGDRWLQFLNATGRTEDFTRYPGTVLGDAQYQPGPVLTDEHESTLLLIARHWIRHHRC
jgi:hypothetical protein